MHASYCTVVHLPDAPNAGGSFHVIIEVNLMGDVTEHGVEVSPSPPGEDLVSSCDSCSISGVCSRNFNSVEIFIFPLSIRTTWYKMKIILVL